MLIELSEKKVYKPTLISKCYRSLLISDSKRTTMVLAKAFIVVFLTITDHLVSIRSHETDERYKRDGQSLHCLTTISSSFFETHDVH